jgi:hypothetical protein
MRLIGKNHGIDATRKLLEKLDPQKTTAWIRLFGPATSDNEGTLYKLVEGHNELTDMHIAQRLDALEKKVFGSNPDPEPEPEPIKKYAPQTYNLGSGNQDPRYCIAGLPVSNGRAIDTDNIQYDLNGLNTDGRRNRNKMVAGLKPSDMMDGKEACEGYEWQGTTFPGGKDGWPADSYTL